MTGTPATEVDVVVIGGGQAGLAAGHHLSRRGIRFTILDRHTRPGETWRRRWDSLRLFTPAGFSHLPGLRFPAARAELPTKDAMAAYLADYVDRFALPLEPGTTVDSVRADGGRFLVTASDGRYWRAPDVVVATGAHHAPSIPGLAADLDPALAAVHSIDYRRPDQLPPGAVLVVGAGNSGAEIAIDLARAGRTVSLAGRDVGHVPRMRNWTYPLMRSLGRPGAALAQRGLRGGAEPLGRIRPGDLDTAGVRRVPRVTGTSDRHPRLADGTTPSVAAVVWCTGLRPDHRFLHLPVFDAEARLVHRRGATDAPGLHVVGMPNQSSITSHLVGGVGADAAYVVGRITAG